MLSIKHFHVGFASLKKKLKKNNKQTNKQTKKKHKKNNKKQKKNNNNNNKKQQQQKTKKNKQKKKKKTLYFITVLSIYGTDCTTSNNYVTPFLIVALYIYRKCWDIAPLLYQSLNMLEDNQITGFEQLFLVMEENPMSQLMSLWHFSSSVNLFFKCACAAIQWS